MDEKMIERITTTFRDLGFAFASAREAMRTHWYAGMETAYLESHRRLPGSHRTARLRKKRRSKVMAWASRQCGPQDRV
jgi:predicted metal-dependent hydrolase